MTSFAAAPTPCATRPLRYALQAAAELALDDDDPLTLHPAASLHPPWRR